MMMKKVSLILFLIGIAFSASAQKERKLVREGNDLYDKQDFEKAEVEYRKALDKKTDSYEAAFNLDLDGSDSFGAFYNHTFLNLIGRS